MTKKFFFSLLLGSCLFGGLYFTFSKPPVDISPNAYCAFCDPDVLNRQKFYEDALVLALYTHKPVVPGHCLIIPRRHVDRFEKLTSEEITQMGQVIKKVHEAATRVFDAPSYLLLQKNGREVGQTVPHVHFHYMPRKIGDSSRLTFLAKMFIADLKGPISPKEMQEIVEKMKAAMNEQKEP